MMNNGKYKHFVIAAVLFIYLLSVKPLYVQFFVRNGKPERLETTLPAPVPAGDVVFRISHLRQVHYEGQSLYELRGFAFRKDDPLKEHTIRMVLVSSEDDTRLVYPAETVAVPSMLRSFEYEAPVNEQAEFRVLFAKPALPAGTYSVGLLLESKDGERLYVLTGSTMEKTPNHMRYRRPTPVSNP